MSTWERTADPDVEVYHPRRDEASVQATRAAVVLLLIASIALLVVITIGGWSALAGMKVVQILFIVLYAILLMQALRWSRGSLPVSAAFAVIVAILALVSVSSWFNRDAYGYTSPGLPESTVGVLVALLIPVQALLIVFAARGFSQGWNVEEERPPRRDFTEPRPRSA
jgi:hypothetical protein